MAETDFLTTKATLWSCREHRSPPWINGHEIFDAKFPEDVKLPLENLGTIGLPGRGVEKCRTEDGRLVAVKGLLTYNNPAVNLRLQNEVRILRSLKHYHSVSILGTYMRGDRFDILMEPCAITDLYTYLSEPKSVAYEKVETRCGSIVSFLPKIMGCLAHGLQYLHKEPKAQYNSDEGKIVRHRDITPGNIVLDGPRVLYTDFGLSKFVTATQTGSSGHSHKTLMYTSPERADEKHRNTSCDIFSLACVFAEIFNVYKGKTVADFFNHRRKADPEGDGYFYKAEVMPEVLKWLDDLATERCDVQIIRLLRNMFSTQPNHRPNAEQVWKTLTTITNSSPISNNIYFCGPCCMPLQHGELLLETDPGVDISESEYASSLPLPNATPISRDLYFKDKYDKSTQLDIRWIRNLRHWNYAILDVVHGNYPHLLARKRIISTGNDEGSDIAKNEAEILRTVKHRHVVALHGTYRHRDVFTLLFEPAADHDLRSYLELAELHDNVDLSVIISSFGCLASALACVHAAGYDHGDIRPENILVHDRRVYLSKFSFGLKSTVGTHVRRSSNQQLYRVLDIFGGLTLGKHGDSEASACTGRQHRQQSDHYRPPEWQSTCVGQPTADIFALGCVFLEIYTVLCGRRVRDFAGFRADDQGEIAYHRTLPKTLEWLSQLNNKEHENEERFQGVIRDMIAKDASKRPQAVDVARIMRECKTSGGLIFGGDCNDHV